MKVSVTKRRSAAAGPPPPTTTTAASTRPSKSSAAAATCSRRDKQASIDDDLPQQQRTQLHPPPKQPVPATAVVLPPPPPPTKSTVSKTVAVSSLAAIREKYGIGPPGTSVDEIYEKRPRTIQQRNIKPIYTGITADLNKKNVPVDDFLQKLRTRYGIEDPNTIMTSTRAKIAAATHSPIPVGDASSNLSIMSRVISDSVKLVSDRRHLIDEIIKESIGAISDIARPEGGLHLDSPQSSSTSAPSQIQNTSHPQTSYSIASSRSASPGPPHLLYNTAAATTTYSFPRPDKPDPFIFTSKFDSFASSPESGRLHEQPIILNAATESSSPVSGFEKYRIFSNKSAPLPTNNGESDMGRVILQSLQQLQQQQSPRSVSPSAKKVLDFADSPSPNYETMGYYEILQKNRLSQNQQQQPRLVNPVHSSLPVEETNSQPLCPLPPSSPALLMSERDSTSLTQPFPAYTATPAIQHQVATTVEEISSSTTAAELALSSKQDQVNVANSSTSPPPSSSAPLSSTKKDGVVENVQELSATPDESIVEFLRSLSQTTSHEPIYSQKERFIFKKPYMFDRTSFLYRTILGGAVDEENSAYLETGPSSLSLSAATPHTNEPPILAEHDSFDYSQIPRHNFDMNPVAVIDSFSQTEPVKVLTAEEQEAELVRIAFEKEQATALALAEASAIAAAEAVAKNALLEAEALAAAEEADLLRKSKSSTTRKKSIAHSRRSSTVSGGLMPPDSVGSAAGTGDLLEVGGGFGHQHARRVSYTGGGASAPGSSIVGYRRMSSVSQASKPSYAVTTADQAVTTTVCNTKRPSTVSFSNQRRQLTSIATVELTKNVLVTEPLSSSPPPSLSSPTASTSTSPSMLPVSSITTAAAQTGGVKEAPVTQEDGLVFNARSESPSHSEMVAVHAVLDSYLSVESPHRTAVSPSATEQRNSLLQIASTSSNSSSSPLPPLPLLPPSSADETSSATLLTLINEHSSEAKPPVMMSQAVPTQQMEEPMLSIDSNEAEIGGKETSNSGSFSQPIITTPIIDKEEIKVEKAVDTPPAIDAGEKKLDAVVAMATGTTSIVNFSSSITEIGQTLPALAVTPQPQEDSATLASQATLNVATIKEKQSKLSQDTIDMLTRRLAGLESELKVVDTLIENIKL